MTTTNDANGARVLAQIAGALDATAPEPAAGTPHIPPPHWAQSAATQVNLNAPGGVESLAADLETWRARAQKYADAYKAATEEACHYDGLYLAAVAALNEATARADRLERLLAPLAAAADLIDAGPGVPPADGASLGLPLRAVQVGWPVTVGVLRAARRELMGGGR